MRLHTRLSACCIASCLLLGYQQSVPTSVTAQTPTKETFPKDVLREMGTLAFISYLGDELTGSGVEPQLTKCLNRALDKQAEEARVCESAGELPGVGLGD